jgi:UDP-hydrolysing UDP-N-acetyl-D-glucosamine 2-epimerase
LKNKKKICVVINNRANYARIKSFLLLANADKKVDLKIILAGSSHLFKYGDITKIIKKDKLKIYIKLHTVVEGNDPVCMVKTTANLMNELTTAFKNIKPDIVVVIADRHENLAVAIAASYMNICLAHIQGGEVTGSIDESVRHAITKLSHIHFPSTNRAKNFLIRLGEDKKSVFKTGCPSLDLAKNTNKKIDKNFNNRNAFVGDIINFKKDYLVYLFHPVTTEFKNNNIYINEVLKTIDTMNDNIQIVILWPNVDSGTDFISKSIRMYLNKKKNIKISAYKNFSPEDYIKLIYNSKCLIGNSSSGIRESSYLGLPVVNIGSRQKNRERGPNVIDVKNKASDISTAIKKQIIKKKYQPSSLYGQGDAGKKILKVLLSKDISIHKVLNYLE